HFPADHIPPWQEVSQGAPDPVLIQQDMSSIKHIMWNYVGLVRTTPRLERALSELRHLETAIERFYRATSLTDGVIGLRNAVRPGVWGGMAAGKKKTSRGSNYGKKVRGIENPSHFSRPASGASQHPASATPRHWEPPPASPERQLGRLAGSQQA